MSRVDKAEMGEQDVLKSDEIDIAQVILLLFSYRKWIVACTFAATVLGVGYAFLAPPVYNSGATIALKETGQTNGTSGILSQLGGVGGMVASQLGMGNTSLDKMEIILKGRELAEFVVEENDLLPTLYPKMWDDKKKTWKTTNFKKQPTISKGAERLRKHLLSVKLEAKKGVIRYTVSMSDQLLAKQVADFYLEALNEEIRNDVMQEVESNRAYLEAQLEKTRDPELSLKIQNMIAFEIERYMLVSNQAFEILESPMVPLLKAKPNRIMVVLIACLLGFFASLMTVFFLRGYLNIRSLAKKQS